MSQAVWITWKHVTNAIISLSEQQLKFNWIHDAVCLHIMDSLHRRKSSNEILPGVDLQILLLIE